MACAGDLYGGLDELCGLEGCMRLCTKRFLALVLGLAVCKTLASVFRSPES